jgi:CrcB protein
LGIASAGADGPAVPADVSGTDRAAVTFRASPALSEAADGRNLVEYAWVAIGGGAGAAARYAAGCWLERQAGSAFPYGTFAVNLSGSFLIGVVLTLLLDNAPLDPRLRLFLVVGFLGGYTTFSSYAYEVYALADRGHWLRAAIYVLGSNALGLVACLAGIAAAKRLAGS